MFFDNHDTEKERDSATGYIRIQDNTLILETYSITDLENGKRILADHFPAGLIHREDIYRNSHEFLELLEKSKDKKD